jgi:hypothetical protein
LGGVRRRDCEDEDDDVRVLRSPVFFAGVRPSVAGAVALATPPAAVDFLRLRPPRVPRRRLFADVLVLDCPSSLCPEAGVSTVSGLRSGVSGARVSGAVSSGFLRRNQGSGKRSLL